MKNVYLQIADRKQLRPNLKGLSAKAPNKQSQAMNLFYRVLLSLLFFITSIGSVYSTHVMGGEITYKKLIRVLIGIDLRRPYIEIVLELIWYLNNSLRAAVL